MISSSTRRRGRAVSRRTFFAFAAASGGVALCTPATAQSWLEKLERSLRGGGSSSGLTIGEISDGLLEALRVGTERVVGQVGALDGYNLDPAIHIPLPGSLRKVQSVLKSVGMSYLVDDLELRLNRAAEAAAPEAKELFWQAIGEITFDDARKIYDGPDDSATRYFQRKMTPPLALRMEPVVDKTLADVGAIRAYDAMMGQYKSVPFVPDVKADLTGYVVDEAMDGLFYYVAKEEAAIRNDPAARTTALLKKVFGS
jgi:hypothetical protein